MSSGIVPISKEELYGAMGATAKKVLDEKLALLEKAFNENGKEFEYVLNRSIPKDQFLGIVYAAFRKNISLQQCTVNSVFDCVMKLAQLGLMPNTPLQEAALVPRKNECTVVIMFKGWLKLVYQSDKIDVIQSHVVRSGDVFEYEHGSNERIYHVPRNEPENDADITHAYAWFKTVNGNFACEVMSRQQLNRYRSFAATDVIWAAHFAQMCRKTMILRISNALPIQTNALAFARGIDEDYDREPNTEGSDK